MTGGVDEGDRALLAVDLGGDLVGADGLGDAAGLPGHHIGLADGVQQLGLAVVDVTHHGHHRRPGREILLATFVLAELDVEALQQLAVLVLRRDDLDVVVQLGSEHLQGVVGDRLGGGDHLAQVEQHLDQRGRVGTDLVGQVGQRGAPGQPDLLSVTGLDPDTTDRRCLHLVELLTPLLLGLATPPGRTTGPTEGTLGAATATTATTAAGRRTAGATARGTPSGGARAWTATATGTRGAAATAYAGPTGAAGSAQLTGCLSGHHRRVRARHARNAGTPAAGSRRPARRTLGSAWSGGARESPAAPAAGPCPGRWRTGCCPVAGSPDAGGPGHRPAVHRSNRTWARARLGLPVAGAFPGPRRRWQLTGRAGHAWPGGRAPTTCPAAGCGPPGRSARRGDRRDRVGRGGAVGGGAGASSTRTGGGAAGAAGAVTTGAAAALDGRGRCVRCGRSLLRRLLGRRRLAGQLLLEAPLDGRLHGGGGRAYELPHVLQHAEDGLAFDSELFRKLVDTDLGHCSPCWRSAPEERTS